jgi:hypothetical protein
MARKTIKSSTKWSLAVTVAIKTPRNPKHLKAALSHLGPFQYDTQAEALASGHYIEVGTKRFGLSREFAVELVEDAAKVFNAESHLEHNAPRFKHVLAGLSKTQRLANALASHLNSLDDITKHELQFAGASKEMRHQFEQVMRDADAQELPKKSTDTCDGPCLWVLRLKKLSSYVEITRANLIERRKRNNRGVDDVGGNTNLWKEDVGIPRWGLVNDALWIYEAFKPGDAKATIKTGGFYQFVHDLYEYATGRDAAVHAKVDDWIKRLVKPNRQDKQAKANQEKLDDEWDQISDKDPELLKRINRVRIAKIKKDLDEIALRRDKYWRDMFPHVRLKPRPD